MSNEMYGTGDYTIIIKRGSHRIGPVKDENGVVIHPGVTLQRGSRFKSKTDLSKFDSIKFANAEHLAGVSTLSSASEDELKAELDKRQGTAEESSSEVEVDSSLTEELGEMTLPDLKTYASELGVSYSSNITKDALIKKISEAI